MNQEMTPKKRRAETPEKDRDMRLEEAMGRLDEVVSALDRENTDLEEALRLYEEGVRLVALCNKKLADAKRTIEILKVNKEGEITREPFSETTE